MISKAMATVAMAAGLMGMLAGCQSIGGLTHSEDGREAVVWNQPLDGVDPPAPDRSAVYVQFRDLSGRGVQLRDELRDQLRARGYTVVMNPDTADYRLEVAVTAFDRNYWGDSRDTASWAASDGSRVVAGEASREAVGSSGPLGAAGGWFSALVGERVANDTKSKAWGMVAEVKLWQRDRGDCKARVTAWSSKVGQTDESAARNALLPRLCNALAEALPAAI